MNHGQDNQKHQFGKDGLKNGFLNMHKYHCKTDRCLHPKKRGNFRSNAIQVVKLCMTGGATSFGEMSIAGETYRNIEKQHHFWKVTTIAMQNLT